ncbi:MULTISPECIES: hypothetical protein [unclassified Moorena]|uniref:hypothetical protein n=1 Tax=unclassified Moorena TaxID=2683338 RepID=UPI0013F7CCCB|nr:MULTISPECIES: hypothetical protein [unclassified Moorena]NEO13140.1 hypothetical protein [Moorena sp. SIO3E8]NEP29472.1 hypothetical protein [Moorena sp. SIO3I6]NEP98158.1 hypothetical protein [Moorena sp. SIO3F7]
MITINFSIESYAVVHGVSPMNDCIKRESNIIAIPCSEIRCSRFPIPDSRFPIPDSRFPV